MPRRFLGLSEPTWRIVLTGVVTAIWLVVFWTATAHANDCAQYVQNPRNFVGNLQGLVEDCMRTGYVQAITTLLAGGIGGGGIAVAVSKVLKEANKDPKEEKDPKEGEEGEGSGNLPEQPPEKKEREKVPDTCKDLFDRYKAALHEVNGQTTSLQAVRKGYEDAFTNHQNNLAKVTIQLGLDVADLAAGGAEGVKGAMGTARAVAHIPETLRAIRDAVAGAVKRSSNLSTLINALGEEVAGLLARGRQVAQVADDAGRLSAKAEQRISELVRDCARWEMDVGRYDELVRFSRSVDATLLERNAAKGSLVAAQEALLDAEANHQRILNRKQALDDWAATQRMLIENEDAHRFSAKHEDAHNARAKLQQLQAEHAEASRKAHAEWQRKMNDLTAARKELEEARTAAAHTHKARQDKLLAEQELRRATAAKQDADGKLRQAETELAEFDRVAKEVEALRTEIRTLEAELETLPRRLQAAEAKVAEARAKLDRAAALDTEAAPLETARTTLDQKRAARQRAIADQQAFAEGPEMQAYEADLKRASVNERAAHDRWSQAHDRNTQAQQDAVNFQNRGLADEIKRAGFDPADAASFERLRPAKQAELRDRMKALDDVARQAKLELDAADAALRQARADLQPLKAEVDSRHAATLQRKRDLTDARTLADMEEGDASQEIWNLGYSPDSVDQRIRKLQEEARLLREEGEAALPQPGDPEAPDNLKSRLDQVSQDLQTHKYDAASKDSGRFRAEYEQKLAGAKADARTTDRTFETAQRDLATANENVQIADLSGTGEPIDSIHRFETAQARYLEISNEQEALRARYEQLASGGDGPEAAALRQRLEQLDAELARWKNPDWEAEIASKDPAQYAEWKNQQAGINQIAESDAKVAGLTARISELSTDLATIERKLSEQQQQAGDQSTAELEAQRDAQREQLRASQAALETARAEQQSNEQARARAEAERMQLEAQARQKEAEQRQAEADKRASDAEAARLQEEEARLQANPVAPPTDASGLGPTFGSEGWTPYRGSDPEKLAKKSHEWREKFDKFMDGVTPDALTYPFRKAGAKAGEAFRWAFGGQSPEEVADILKRGDARVKEWAKYLKDAEDHFQQRQQEARDAKQALDSCVARNQPAAGGSE